MTSAVPTVNITGTPTAAHRTETPVWAFHHTLTITGWAVDTALYRLQEWEARVIARRPLTAAYVALGLVAAATTALAAMIGGVL